MTQTQSIRLTCPRLLIASGDPKKVSIFLVIVVAAEAYNLQSSKNGGGDIDVQCPVLALLGLQVTMTHV